MEALSWNNAEGLRIHAAHWQVEHPAAVITLVHGQGEHIGRYDHMARWFNARGVAVIGYDHQGYGQSAGRRGHARNLSVFLDDMGQALAETKRLYPGVPHFLYGHSMGGHLVLNYLLRREPDGLAGVIATGPWIRLAFPTPLLKLMMGRLLYRLVPGLQMPNGLLVDALAHDPAVVTAYVNDPYVHFHLSLGAGIALLDGANWLNKYTGKVHTPLLLQHGGADSITSAPATRELANRLQGDVTWQEWPSLYHEIHNEPEKEAVFTFTLKWMKGMMNDE